MDHRRRVVRSARFLEQAHHFFPPGGSAEGKPPFELFEQGPLRAVEELFSRAFEDQLEGLEGTGIRIATTHQVPVFPAMTFFAMLTTDDDVHLVDLLVDEEYFKLIADDPTD